MSWNVRKLFLAHLLIAMMYITWALPITHEICRSFDVFVFDFFNGWLKQSISSQNFWAIMNHGYMDWIYDVVMLAFLVPYILKGKEYKQRRLIRILILIVLSALSIAFINRYLLSNVFHIRRLTPTLTQPEAFRLSHSIHWIKIKDIHHACFPGDHGTTVMLFVISMFHLWGPKIGIFSILASVFFVLPRVVVGAHWATDVMIGSFSIGLFVTSWIFYTPLLHRLTASMEQAIFKVKGLFSRA